MVVVAEEGNTTSRGRAGTCPPWLETRASRPRGPKRFVSLASPPLQPLTPIGLTTSCYYSYQVCFKCRQPGHSLRTCKEAGGEVKVMRCYHCGEPNHRTKDCSQADKSFAFAECFVCNQVGHLASKCSQNKNGLYPDGAVSFPSFVPPPPCAHHYPPPLCDSRWRLADISVYRRRMQVLWFGGPSGQRLQANKTRCCFSVLFFSRLSLAHATSKLLIEPGKMTLGMSDAAGVAGDSDDVFDALQKISSEKKQKAEKAKDPEAPKPKGAQPKVVKF